MADRKTHTDATSASHPRWLRWAVLVPFLGLAAGGLSVMWHADEASQQVKPHAQASSTASEAPPAIPEPRSTTSGLRETEPGSEPSARRFVDVAGAKRVIESIPVKGRAPKTGYDREKFGGSWSDINGNDCDTRNDILTRDLNSTIVTDSCIVESGVLVDPFSGRSVSFERGATTSMAVQIDHVVSLSNAWQTGAQQLSEQQRTEFANDPGNLLAVRGDLNLQKRDGDAATWLPPDKSFRCQFVAIQVLTKHKHGLWLTPFEKDAALRIFENC